MRNEKREGLIRTRLNGIKAATGDTIGPVINTHPHQLKPSTFFVRLV